MCRCERSRLRSSGEAGVHSTAPGAISSPGSPLHRLRCHCKTICLTMASMADTITIRTDEETEHALDVLTHDGSSRSAAIRQALLDAARRRERAAEIRRAVLRRAPGQ